MRKCFLMLVMIGLTCSSAFGADPYNLNFDGGGGTTNWHTATNWQYDRLPFQGTIPRIGIYLGAVSDVTVDITDNQGVTGGLVIGWDSWGPYTSTLNLNGTSDLWCKDAGSAFKGQSYGVVNINDSSYGRAAIVWMDGMKLNLNGSDCWFQFATNDWQILDDSYVSVNAGELRFTNGSTFSAYDDATLGYNTNFTGTIDVTGGKLQFEGDDQDAVNWHINNGNIIASQGGVLDVDYDGTYTWVQLFDFNPFPVNETVYYGDVELSWTNLDPNLAGDSVYVDVWFGTDPATDFTKVVSAGQDVNSIIVDASAAPETYYWQVNSYIYGDPAVVEYNNEPNFVVVESHVFAFDTTNDLAPTVDAGEDMMTWVDEPVQLAPTIVDDGASLLTYSWTATDPNAVFSDDSIAAPTVTVDYPAGDVTLTLTIQDGYNPAESDDMVIRVYEDACTASVDGAGQAVKPTDLYFDCRIDLLDLAEVAANWLDDYALVAPIPIP